MLENLRRWVDYSGLHFQRYLTRGPRFLATVKGLMEITQILTFKVGFLLASRVLKANSRTGGTM